MMRFMCKRRGAISVFLIIVLLPMMMISAIFVDESRIQLAKSMASSAGDLTMNSALTDYDSVLKDMYGLFASSQNIDEIYDKLEEYYKQAIMSAGISDDDANDYVGDIMSLIKSETGSDDLMKLNLTDFKVGQAKDGNLANPAQMKVQIVEFMKYRAPLSLGSGLLDGLNSMKYLKKQSENIDNKNSFYKQQQSLLEKLESAWKELQRYQYKDANDKYFPSGYYFSTNNTDMDNNKKKVEWAIEDTIKYLHFDGSKLGYSTCKIELDPKELGDNWDDEWTFTVLGSNVSSTKAYSKTSINVTLDDVIDKYNDAYKAVEKLADETKTTSDTSKLYYFIERLPDNADKWTYVRWMYVLNKFNNEAASGYVGAVKDCWKALIDLQSAIDAYGEIDENEYIVLSDGKFIKSDKDTSGSYKLKKACDDQLNHLIKKSYDDDGNLIGVEIKLEDYFGIFNNFMSRLEAGATKISGIYETKKTNVESELKTTRDKADEYYSLINEKIGNLSTAITLLSEVKGTLDNSGSDYNTAKKKWSTSAGNIKTTSMGQNDIDEIKNLESMISSSDIGSLITKLEESKKSLEIVKGQIEGYKLSSTSWKDFGETPGSSVITDIMSEDQKNRMNSIVPTSTDESDYDSLINEVKGAISTGGLSVFWSDAGDNNPDLTKNIRNFYKWLYNNYNDPNIDYNATPSSEVSKTKTATEGKDYKDQISDLEKSGKKDDPQTSIKTNSDVVKYKAALPSGGNTEGDKAISDSEGSTNKSSEQLASDSSNSDILAKIAELAGNLTTNARDNMYVTSYIMGMFTYDTYENEIVKKNGGSTIGSWYTKSGESYTLNSGFSSYLSHAKSITRTDIKPDNNYLYGSEVEYIIYGGEDSSKCKDKAYGTIFMLRFALNSVYAFSDAKINTISTSMATALFGVPPLTPLIPIAKIAITLALSLAESTYDLYQLKCGDAVPLIKNSKTWMMKPSTAAGKVVAAVADKAVDAGYKKLNELIAMTDEELTKLINSGTDGINSLADSVVDSTTEKFVNYATEATNQLVSYINDVNLKFMSDDISTTGDTLDYSDEKKQMVIDMLDKWLEQQKDGDEAIYDVKKAAVDYIKSGTVIKETFEAVKATAGKKIEGVQTAIEEQLNIINKKIKTNVESLTNTAGTKLNELKTQCKKKINEAAKEGSEKLREEIKNQIGNVFGTSAGDKVDNEKNSVVGNLLSWRYSDYLTLFLFISTMADDKGVLIRTADVIQLNIEHINKKYATTADDSSAFVMKNASTYLTMEATIEVKPLMMALPFMADTTKSKLTGTSWYTVKYKGTVGY